MALPWQTLAQVKTDEGLLELRQRGDKDFLIQIAGRVLMTSSAHRSEDVLAQLACQAIDTKKAPRVLVSGLGMGFTLRAALDVLPANAKVVVVEINQVVAEWCHGPLASLTAHATADARVTLQVADVADYITKASMEANTKRFDAIILDMYAGPLSHVRSDDPLYSFQALQRAHRALANDGIFAIWGEARSSGFERELERSGFTFTTAKAGHGARIHWIYLARKAS